MKFFGRMSKFEIIVGAVQLLVLISLVATLIYSARQFELARDEAEARTRPYVGIDDVRLTHETDEDCYYYVCYKNFGVMPAVDIAAKVTIKTQSREQDFSTSQNQGLCIFPGRVNEHPFSIPNTIVQAVLENEDYARIIIDVEYGFAGRRYHYYAELQMSSDGTWEILTEESY